MSLIPMREMLNNAMSEGYAVGYFEAWDQCSFEAVLEAAEESRSPVILGFGGVMMNQDWFGERGLKGLASLGRSIVETARVPVSYLLNEVLTHDHIKCGLGSGFNAVMLDTSHLSLEQNISETKKVVEAARRFGADVEGESDPLPDASGTMGEYSGSKMTDPEEAARFVSETGVCALSVAIGNEHIQFDAESAIDFDLLAKIQKAVGVPLVIHGGTGFPDSAVPRAIELGVAKFNVGSILKQLYLKGICESVDALPVKVDIQEVVGSRKAGDLLQRSKELVKEEVMRRMKVYGSAGKA